MKTNVFQCAITALAAILFAFVYPAEAKVVYRPIGVTISGNGSLQLDLNNDKKLTLPSCHIPVPFSARVQGPDFTVRSP